MEFSDLKAKALQVRDGYNKRNALDGHNEWGSAEYVQGFMGDVGDLAKLVMAKNNLRHFRDGRDVDEAITHELADCLWSTIVLADVLNVNLEVTFSQTMDEIVTRDNLA